MLCSGISMGRKRPKDSRGQKIERQKILPEVIDIQKGEMGGAAA